MNQILVTEKLYVTPELKRKKKLYRFEFFISVFLLCILFSYYIYAEYDRNKSEEVSQEILENMVLPGDTQDGFTPSEDGILLVVLDEDEQRESAEEEAEAHDKKPSSEVYTTESGDQYTIIGRIVIPKIEVDYPILSKSSDELLKIAPNRFWGGEPNEVGNLSIVGHNYRNKKFFSKVPTLENGDIIQITDMSGKTLDYRVYDKHIVDPDDTSDTDTRTNGKREVTLITCTDDSKQRWVVKATEVI